MNTTFRLKPEFSFKKVIAASIIAISLPLASVALAHDEGQGHDMAKGAHCERGANMHHGMGKPGMPPYLQGLQLSSAQEDQLFALMYPQIPTMRDQHKQRIQLMEELHAASQADKFDEAKVQQLADKMAGLEKQKVMMMARNDAKIFALLTPEQRKKAREFKMPRHEFGHGFHHSEADQDEAIGHEPVNLKQPTPHPSANRVM
jgi:protein CpxP